MNRLGVHALVWVGDWASSSARYAFEATARIGYDLIDFPLLEPTAVDTSLAAPPLQDTGLSASCCLGLDPSCDVSSDNDTNGCTRP